MNQISLNQLCKIGVILFILITPFFYIEIFAENSKNRSVPKIRPKIQTKKEYISLQETQKLYDKILDLEFDYDDYKKEEKEVGKIKTPIHLVVEDFRDMLFILLTQDNKNYDKLEKNEDIRLEELGRFDTRKSIYYKQYKWAKAEIRLHHAIVKLFFDEKWAAAWRIRQAYKLLLENEKEFPTFIEQKKSLGLLQIVLASVPEKYQWALDLIGMEGDLKNGMRKLEKSTATIHFFQNETLLWKSLLQTYLLEENEEAKQSTETLLKKYPSQKGVLLVYSLVLMKNEQHETALLAWQNYAREYQDDKLVFSKPEHFSLEYLLAELYFYSEKPRKAKFHYISFLNSVKDKKFNFIKNSYYKLFLIDWFSNDDTDFNPKNNSFFILIFSSGISKTTADRQAEKIVKYVNESNQLPNKSLYQSKVLTDGGNYQKALEIIHQINKSEVEKWQQEKKFENVLEYTYRKARILDKLSQSKTSQINKAISFYEEVIHYSTLHNQNGIHYFAANSALMLGFIYQKIDKKLAKIYFEKAIRFEGHEYEESITQKAKLALKKL